MKTIKGIGVLCTALLILFCALAFTPIRGAMYGILLRVAPARVYRNRNETAQVDFALFSGLREHRWADAHSLLTDHCQSSVSEDWLRKKWEAIEAAYGKNEVWQRNEENQSLFPNTVENKYLLRGSRGIAKASLRLVRRDRIWRIDAITLNP